VKTMIIPMFIHVFSVLPDPEKDFFQKINAKMKQFIWNNGKVRLSLDQLAQDIESGGLKLTKIETLAKSLKIAWVKRIYTSSGDWQTFHKTILEEKHSNQIWELDEESLRVYSKKIKNKFWKQVVLAWADYINCTDEQVNESERPFWNGYYLRNENLRKLKDKMYINGCRQIKHLFDETNGALHTYNSFCQKYDVQINPLDFMSLVQSIPKAWKDKTRLALTNINTDENKSINSQTSNILETDRVCNHAYWKILPKYAQNNNNNATKWCDIFQIEHTSGMWAKIYRSPVHATRDTKLRTFQYKLLKRILPTNMDLKLFKIKQHDRCSFCDNNLETYEHLFFECAVIHALLDDLISWWTPHLVLTTPISAKHVILGYVQIPCNDTENLINTLLLIFKNYIYKSKCKNENLVFDLLLKDIKQMYIIEVNSKQNPKGKKWKLLENQMKTL